MSWLSDLIHAEDTVEKLHAELTTVLGEQKKRFLIVIDDIDRLSPDEALLTASLSPSAVCRTSSICWCSTAISPKQSYRSAIRPKGRTISKRLFRPGSTFRSLAKSILTKSYFVRSMLFADRHRKTFRFGL